MQTHPLVGHHEARARLSQAVAAERLPQLLLLTGPAGIGKQRLGLWLGQLLLCEQPGKEPCGACIPCRQVLALGHPDLHWIVPVARPKSADPDKQVEELAEALAAAMAERRSNPLYGPASGLEAHFVATARLLQRRASLTPVVGRRKVFLVAEADRLVPQEANPEAANALLKLLEEPPADTQFILTTVDPNALLPTVRSRLVPLRLGRLADAEVARFLGEQIQPPLASADLTERVRLADGSIGVALAEGATGEAARRASEEFLQAALGGPAGRLERALQQGPFAARGDFTELLNAVAADLSEAARTAAGAARGHSVPRALAGKRSPAALVRAVERVSAAREAAQGNVNPQLLLAVLGAELAEIL